MTEIVTILVACVGLSWEPASGPVDHYEVYVGAELETTVSEPPATICLDQDGMNHAVVVYALDVVGSYSEPSPALLVERVFDCDEDRSGVVNIPDLFRVSDRVGEEGITIQTVFDCIPSVGCTNNGVVQECP